MFHRLTAALSAGVLALLVTGCAEKEPAVPDALAECIITGEEAPEWVCGINAMPEGTLTAVGSEPFRRLGSEFARNEALAHARAQLQQTIRANVYANIQHFARALGEKAGGIADRHADEIAGRVADESIDGARQIKYWKHPKNGTVYVLLAVSRYQINDRVKKALLSEYKSSDDAYKAFEEADGEDALEEHFPIR
jgi:hypothetical protein